MEKPFSNSWHEYTYGNKIFSTEGTKLHSLFFLNTLFTCKKKKKHNQ